MLQERSLLWTAVAPSLLLLVVVGVAVAGSVTIPNTFVPGQVADANQVNDNFQAVRIAVNDNDTRITTNQTSITTVQSDVTTLQADVVQVFAERDNNFAGVTETNTGQKEMNSINISVPTDGVLVISGGVFINSNEAGVQAYNIHPRLDGANISPTPAVGAAYMEASGAAEPELFSLNYTVSIAVTAGAHTVSQTAGPNSGLADFFHNGEYLTVLFVPTGTVTAVDSPP